LKKTGARWRRPARSNRQFPRPPRRLARAAPAAAPTQGDVAQPWGALVAFATLLVVFVTLTPFSDLGDLKLLEVSTGAESALYLTIFTLAGTAAFLLRKSAMQVLRPLAAVENIALLVWLAGVSVALSADPATSARRFVITCATFFLAAMLPWLTQGLRQVTNLLALIAVVVLGMSYLGMLVVPELTIHQLSDVLEPNLAGDWRGIYAHKNVAAGIIASLVYVGWFVARVKGRWLGVPILAGAALFLLFSGGKSAIGLTVIVGALAFAVSRAHSLTAKCLLAFGPLVLLAFISVGSLLSEAGRSVLALLPIDPTFTGRTEVWRYALDTIMVNPLKGHGFEAFWYSEGVRYSGEDYTRWMVEVGTSHNGYVDLALTTGLPGLALFMLAFLVRPLRDFHATLDTPENRSLSRLLLLLWMFSLYLGTFEAFFLSRADTLWFIFALATCGLRYTSQWAVRS